jgi:hypothetical protein
LFQKNFNQNLHMEVMNSQSNGINNLTILELPFWRFRNLYHFNVVHVNCPFQHIPKGKERWHFPSLSYDIFCDFMLVHGLFMDQFGFNLHWIPPFLKLCNLLSPWSQFNKLNLIPSWIFHDLCTFVFFGHLQQCIFTMLITCYWMSFLATCLSQSICLFFIFQSFNNTQVPHMVWWMT